MKTYLITGATGLVGGSLVNHLLDKGERVVAYVRDLRKAQELLGNHPHLELIEGKLEDLSRRRIDVDFIIHAASPTDSSYFVNHPVETIDAIVIGTKATLDFAKNNKVQSMVFLSSMEVYGAPEIEEEITEDKQYYLDISSVRSSYPIAKRLAETLCISYQKEFSVPVKVVRLAQVLGHKILPNDNRLIAQLVRSAKKRIDIQLATDGGSKQTYIDIDDAVSGILVSLESGENGSIYNLGNDQTYCSILDVANLVAHDFANNEISVITNTDPDTSKYPPTRYIKLNSKKLEGLGWTPRVGLKQSLSRLFNETN